MKTMKKLFENSRKPGSSSSGPTTEAVPDEDKVSVENFVNKVVALASGTVTGDEHIEQLAGMIGKAIFSVAVSGGVHGRVQDYWVGLWRDNQVRFTDNKVMLEDPKHEIPRALVVRTTKSDALAITATVDRNLESIAFKPGQYEELDLADRLPEPGCLFILTTVLSGCTFAIGCQGTRLYMGHAQPHKETNFAKTGMEVAANLKEKRQTMFENVENLESTFLVSPGREFKIEASEGTITYRADEGYADIIGLVCNHKIYFIVDTRRGLAEISHVLLVTQETGTRTWTTRQMQ